MGALEEGRSPEGKAPRAKSARRSRRPPGGSPTGDERGVGSPCLAAGAGRRRRRRRAAARAGRAGRGPAAGPGAPPPRRRPASRGAPRRRRRSIAQRRAHGNRHVEEGDRQVAAAGREEVGDPGGADRAVAGLPHPDQDPEEQEQHQIGRPARKRRAQAPDRDAGGDQALARQAVAQVAEERRGEKVAEQEGEIEAAQLAVGKVQLPLDRGQDRGRDLPVEVVEEVDPGQRQQRGRGVRGLVHRRRPRPART